MIPLSGGIVTVVSVSAFNSGSLCYVAILLPLNDVGKINARLLHNLWQ